MPALAATALVLALARSTTFLLGSVQPGDRVRAVKRLVGVEKYADLKAALDEALRAAP